MQALHCSHALFTPVVASRCAMLMPLVRADFRNPLARRSEGHESAGAAARSSLGKRLIRQRRWRC
jgi:hypothetical protein